MDRKKKKRLNDYENGLKREREQQAENRRQLLKNLTPKARDFAAQEFARIGLTQ